jgi:hypothetical protein
LTFGLDLPASVSLQTVQDVDLEITTTVKSDVDGLGRVIERHRSQHVGQDRELTDGEPFVPEERQLGRHGDRYSLGELSQRPPSTLGEEGM